MPRWNGSYEAVAVATPFAHQMYLRSRVLLERLRKSDAAKAELAIKESVSTTK